MNNVEEGLIWQDPKHHVESEQMSSPDNDAHYKMSVKLSEIVANKIGNNFDDKKIITNLIKHHIQDQMRQFLKEYDNEAAKDILNSLLSNFRIFAEIELKAKIDTEHVRHAKLNSFSKELIEILNTHKKKNVGDLIKKIEAIPRTTQQYVTANGDREVWLSQVVEVVKKHFNDEEEK